MQPSFRQALGFWFKLGFISFGGPAGQIATVHQELVENKQWVSEERFLHALNYCMLLPGPEALQLVIYMGWLMHRTIGGLIAGIFFILPAIVLLIFLSILYVLYGQSPFATGILIGIKPAVTAIVIAAGYRISKKILKKPIHYVIACFAFIGIQLHVPYPEIIIGAALIGYVMQRFYPNVFATTAHSEPVNKVSIASSESLHEVSRSTDHTIFTWQKLLITLAISITAWVLPLAVLMLIFGADTIFTKLALFFTKAALLTFGGAYAVLPYVFQAMVDNFHWLNASQMMDGLALGETTPGPLIIVVTFVGFVVAYSHSALLNSHLTAGILGALVVSWFTFLPSFCFIFIGGPLIESTRKELKLIPILNSITCAVVGVIASLAVFFASHTLFPEGLISIDNISHISFSLGIIVVAATALITYQQSIFKVMGFAILSGSIAYQFGLR